MNPPTILSQGVYLFISDIPWFNRLCHEVRAEESKKRTVQMLGRFNFCLLTYWLNINDLKSALKVFFFLSLFRLFYLYIYI